MSDEAWQRYKQALPATVCDVARASLLQEYASVMKDRLDLGRHAGVLPRAKEPVYRWARYKEAYAPLLVREVLDQLLPNQSRVRAETPPLVYDPMVGSGTSLLVAAERGLSALGADLLPYATFLASTLTRWRHADPDGIRQVANDALSGYASLPGESQLDVPAADWAFAPAVATTLTQLINAVDRAPAGVNRDLVRLAVLSAVEQVSYAVKDGTSLRRRLPDGPARPGRPGQQREAMDVADVIAGVQARVDAIITDLERTVSATDAASVDRESVADTGFVPRLSPSTCAAKPASRSVTVVRADTRQWRPAAESCAAVVFSPPYPNRYDYSAVYQLELALGAFVSDAAGLRRVRKQLLRSHLEAPPRDEYRVEHPALREFLAAVNGSRTTGDQAGRVLRMVAGFFEDMADVLARVAEALQAGGSVGLVVGTQTYYGQHLPTDLLLAELATTVGLEVRELWIARAKGVASQQRGMTGLTSLPSRETVLILQKPPSAPRRGRRSAAAGASPSRTPRRRV
ncbi:hypothetical protein [Rugosimonospora africana]|uniref:DNA modification methyltransferase n=1 Tax=Rugosimonospora africana TaxID=556532 RepID=A0A8J3QU58_9ACTN|nr:hypothetical protein [Rugosimonospora africana]GIH16057.1 DNA modification methyltransferase [Rugosimonospora africana]